MNNGPLSITDFASAALRHLRDAETLAPSSPDQTFHIAGFAPECARKATLANSRFTRALGHLIGGPADEILEIAISLDPEAARYATRDWHKAFPKLAAWRPECRYEKTGARTNASAAALLGEATDATLRIIGALWADGRLPAGRLR